MKRLVFSVTICLFLILTALLVFSPIDPVSWEPPKAADSALSCAAGEADGVLRAETLVDNLPANLDGLVVNGDGDLYATSPNGVILRVDHISNSVAQTGQAKGRYLTGLAMSGDEDTLYATDELNGALYRFDQRLNNPEGELLIDQVDGTRLYWANDAAWTPAGPVFTTSSQSRGLDQFFEEVLEHNGTGQLISYDENTGQASVITDDLHMANGVAWLGGAELLVVETTAYRIVKIDLQTKQRSVVIDNLPGFPGNIRAAADRPGVFWATLISPRNDLVDDLADKPLLRRLMAWLPASMRPAPTTYPCVVELDMRERTPEFRTYRLEAESPLPSFSTVIENNGQLYLSPAGLAGVDDRRIITAPLPQTAS